MLILSVAWLHLAPINVIYSNSKQLYIWYDKLMAISRWVFKFVCRYIILLNDLQQFQVQLRWPKLVKTTLPFLWCTCTPTTLLESVGQ